MRGICFAILFFFSSTINSHEIKPAIVDLIIADGQASIDFKINAEQILSGVDASQYQDTNDAPQAELYDQFREKNEEELKQDIKQNWNLFQDQITINGLEGSSLSLVDLIIDQDVNPEYPRDTNLKTEAPLNQNEITIQFATELGPVVIRQFEDISKENMIFSTYLQPGEISAELSPLSQATMSQTIIEYIILGMEHIVPKGLDHILFIFGVFFFAVKLKPLLWQVTMFTLAHSLTLILASLKLVFIPASIIEPLIALSIGYVAFENIFQRQSKFHSRSNTIRYAVIFFFGLIHGLGFAFVLEDIGLPTGQLILSLLSFNIGVEIAQIGLVVLAYLLMFYPSKQLWYRKAIQIPCSLVIGLIGIYWFFERVFF
ncbi:HupE/UreJ protein [alpha proteobacterium HIMB59]|nr:HupE/UreJ protein [alpha proteobacterium HIMB59]